MKEERDHRGEKKKKLNVMVNSDIQKGQGTVGETNTNKRKKTRN